jgi:hypothetical protein
MDCLCRSNVEDDERICAIILFKDVSDDCSIDDASDPMKIMRNRIKPTRTVQNTARRMIINSLKWTLLKIVLIGKDNMKCEKVKVLHTFDADGNPALLARQGQPLRPSKHKTISLEM